MACDFVSVVTTCAVSLRGRAPQGPARNRGYNLSLDGLVPRQHPKQILGAGGSEELGPKSMLNSQPSTLNTEPLYAQRLVDRNT